jgi:L-lysine 2,3-aminomutase
LWTCSAASGPSAWRSTSTTPGTAHFRVPLKQGLALYRELQKSFGESSKLPAYAVDLPGGGKIRLSEADLSEARIEDASIVGKGPKALAY